MERLAALGFWVVVALVVLGTVPWVLAQLSTAWLVVAVVAAGAGLVGRHLRQRGGLR